MLVDELHRLTTEHARARRRYEAALEDLRRGSGDEAATSATLELAERVIEARTAVWSLLTAHGWSPPAQVAAELALDAAVLETWSGALRG